MDARRLLARIMLYKEQRLKKRIRAIWRIAPKNSALLTKTPH